MGAAGDTVAPGDVAAWRLDPAPLTNVGASEADPLFGVAGVAVTERHVVIAQESTGTLRFYDRSGSLDREVGGRGEGPGEFGGLGWMRRAADRLVAYDRDGREISMYALDGELLGTIALQPPEAHLPGLEAVGAFPDGSVLARQWDVRYRPMEPEVRRSPVTLLRFDDQGAFAGRLLEMNGPETWYEPFGRGGSRQMFRLFGRTSEVAVAGSRFVVLENDSYDILVHELSGAVRDTLRPVTAPSAEPLMRSRAELARNALLDSQDLGEARGEVERILAAMDLPDRLPPYGRLSLGYPDHPPLTAADGLVWALRYGGLPGEDAEVEGPEWFVFRPGSGQIATLSSPDDVVLYDVAGDLAAVLRRTELDEEVVELRRIVGR